MIVKILRQNSPKEEAYYESFDLEVSKGQTVLDVLKKIQLNPVNSSGEAVTPVVWDCNCLEEVCGACAMIISGIPKMACSTLVSDVISDDGVLVLKPLSKFPVIRDLVVDRTAVHETYRRLKIYKLPKSVKPAKISRAKWMSLYNYTRCISCGICREVCPNTGVRSGFSGASGIALTRALCGQSEIDLAAFKEKGGSLNCSGHSLCSKYCPKKIDLPAAFSYINRRLILQAFKKVKNK